MGAPDKGAGVRRIRFERFGSNTAVGGFAPGDVLRCGAALAHHLVEEAKVARYDEAGAVAADDPTGRPAVKSTRRPAVKRAPADEPAKD